MSKKPKLTEVPGLGPKMEEKLAEAGVKTVAKLSKSKPDKLAAKVEGLNEAGASRMIAAAQELVGPPPTEKPKKKPVKKKTVEEEKPKPKRKPKAKPKKRKKKPEPKVKLVRDTLIDQRLLQIAKKKRKKQPKFRHEQAHRWTRVSDSWRKVRGIDSATREKRKGRIAMVSSGYRKPKSVRGMHPSRFTEVFVERPSDVEGLDPDIHAVRIGSTVGMRKRQEIIRRADALMVRVLNPGAPEAVVEEDLFTDLEGLEVD
ncbi:MAG: 50S ribosomal protein L32e [Candidatus Thorarchaeota archaeon]|nr:MAG: 50S ribosomal protein L32e [Candidatus Thorarchaeota archaeon]